MKLFNREKKPVENKTLIDFPKFKYPILIDTRYFYQCTRCGCLVPEEELELHLSFHRTQDILLEKIMIFAERIEQEQ